MIVPGSMMAHASQIEELRNAVSALPSRRPQAIAGFLDSLGWGALA
jgi:hypothetical protein